MSLPRRTSDISTFQICNGGVELLSIESTATHTAANIIKTANHGRERKRDLKNKQYMLHLIQLSDNQSKTRFAYPYSDDYL